MLPFDKLLHAESGALIGIVASRYFGNPFAGIFAAACIGAAKELYDEWKKSKGLHPVGFDVYDLLWTIAGGVIGSLYEEYV